MKPTAGLDANTFGGDIPGFNKSGCSSVGSCSTALPRKLCGAVMFGTYSDVHVSAASNIRRIFKDVIDVAMNKVVIVS